eukprot:CAMPEP_0175065328 /NCGR_PEP_ID=MMETSP0052_2-20121109/15857_1 /TAXON_ID=51329 ORGANISM="Polytomella parva, Strain SAG 63-3" /NCGR_SAMPLE_ID=MMETSP0052_2 /ASSEMBLY_ACC=CAM_ASM_000194 /LENGTH=352 /DNA_ID=CAMNT_0016331837 /DNA_START=410 /DNA_END=1465 /DNA_ORIENTATION=-
MLDPTPILKNNKSSLTPKDLEYIKSFDEQGNASWKAWKARKASETRTLPPQLRPITIVDLKQSEADRLQMTEGHFREWKQAKKEYRKREKENIRIQRVQEQEKIVIRNLIQQDYEKRARLREGVFDLRSNPVLLPPSFDGYRDRYDLATRFQEAAGRSVADLNPKSNTDRDPAFESFGGQDPVYDSGPATVDGTGPSKHYHHIEGSSLHGSMNWPPPLYGDGPLPYGDEDLSVPSMHPSMAPGLGGGGGNNDNDNLKFPDLLMNSYHRRIEQRNQQLQHIERVEIMQETDRIEYEKMQQEYYYYQQLEYEKFRKEQEERMEWDQSKKVQKNVEEEGRRDDEGREAVSRDNGV